MRFLGENKYPGRQAFEDLLYAGEPLPTKLHTEESGGALEERYLEGFSKKWIQLNQGGEMGELN